MPSRPTSSLLALPVEIRFIMITKAGHQCDGPDPLTPFAVLVVALVTADVSIFPLIASGRGGGAILSALALALLGAQLSLVAAWGVFGTAPFLVRLGRCAALGFGSYLSLMFGAVMVFSSQPSFKSDEAAVFAQMTVIFLACLPLVFFCFQLPLWALRVWLGWETTKADSSASGSYARPVMIKDLVVATVVASVALAMSLTKIDPPLLR